MKQVLSFLLRQSRRSPAAAPAPVLRELDRAALRQVVGGGGTGDSPRTGW